MYKQKKKSESLVICIQIAIAHVRTQTTYELPIIFQPGNTYPDPGENYTTSAPPSPGNEGLNNPPKKMDCHPPPLRNILEQP